MSGPIRPQDIDTSTLNREYQISDKEFKVINELIEKNISKDKVSKVYKEGILLNFISCDERLFETLETVYTDFGWKVYHHIPIHIMADGGEHWRFSSLK